MVLDRPDLSNSIDLAAASLFAEAVAEASDAEIRAVVVRGEGKRFCAGGDVTSMVNAEDRSAYLKQLAGDLDRALQELSALEKPVVAAVHGAVAGAGLGLMLSCDLVVAARSTKFVMAYAGVGLTPDCGVSYLLPRAVGQQRALELALTDRTLSADEAYEWGMVTIVADDVQVLDKAQEIAQRLAESPPFAMAQAKRLLRSSWHTSREDSGADEARTIARASATEEAGNRIASFVGRSETRGA